MTYTPQPLPAFGEGPLVILLYGPSGSLKTRLAAQFPRPLILGCDPGPLGGAESAREFNPMFERIDSYEKVVKTLPGIMEAAKEGKFDTLITDSATYLSRNIMASILRLIKREIPRFDEWNLLVERMRRLINMLAEVSCKYIIFTAVDMSSKDETTGKITGGPDLPGKLQKELPQACDIVCRMYAQSSLDAKGQAKTVYRFRTVPDDTWFAKDRTGLLPADAETNINVFNPIFKLKGDLKC